MSELMIMVDDVNLTENYNIWSKTVEETVLVSSYPLALWFLQSWWRLLYEPFQVYSTGKLSVDWRMVHELGAANEGYVWPKVAFVSDLQNIYIIARPTKEKKQSVRYINGLEIPKAVSLASFEASVEQFVMEVIGRLESLKVNYNQIKELWKTITEERNNPELKAYRKIEALMGYDPDDAEEELMQFAMEKVEEIGYGSLEELAPSYGKFSNESLLSVKNFFEVSGVFGKPIVPLPDRQSISSSYLPWKQAVKDARLIRRKIANEKKPIETSTLFELLGISELDQNRWDEISAKRRASVGIPGKQDGRIKFIPRKRHPLGKRFELARYLGDFLITPDGQWLVNTDLSTARQKYQRAFAAEFLCPIDGLLEYIENDFSKDNLEDAAEYFQVSILTIESILANNGYLEKQYRDYYHFNNFYQVECNLDEKEGLFSI